ncbi:MAG TPA: hypothetical protein VED59_01795 [Acidimicrobiales bacterium]|nr:hypothetical protein [Acidimicrobiales bacterium]
MPSLEEIKSFTLRALRQGMVYLSVWGSSADWITDNVDQLYVLSVTQKEAMPASLITTSHSELQEAVNFFEEDVRPPVAAGKTTLWWVVSLDAGAMADPAVAAFQSRYGVEVLEL